MTQKTFLVTGAAGFIGSHSVDCVLAMGHRVVGLDNLSSGHRDNLTLALRHADFTLIEGDVGDIALLEQLFGEYHFHGVLHLAALVSVPFSFQNPALNYRSNLAATDSVSRVCARFSCSRIVFASSAAVYGDTEQLPNQESDLPHPQSPYATTKLASEVLLQGYAASFGLEVICFRYFNIYGPRQDPSSPYSGVLSIFTDYFSRGQAVTVFGDGEQLRDFVYVKDVARANSLALTMPQAKCGIYNLCTGLGVSLNQVLGHYQDYFPQAPAPRYDAPRPGDIRESRGDPTQLATALGLRMETAFATGIQALIEAKLPK